MARRAMPGAISVVCSKSIRIDMQVNTCLLFANDAPVFSTNRKESHKWQTSCIESASNRPRMRSTKHWPPRRPGAWWTNDTQGESNVGGVIQFAYRRTNRRFRHEGARASSRQAVWQVVGPRNGSAPGQLGTQAGRRILIRPVQTPGWKSRWSSCTIAAPSGRST